jgi:hypothetical protein
MTRFLGLAVLLGSPWGVLAAAPRDDARERLDEVAAAYRRLERYADEGRIVVTTERDGRTDERRTATAIAFERPNRLRLDASTVRMVCDGETLATWNLATKSGTTRHAPAAIRPATITEGSAGAMLLGGPGGRPAALVLELLFAEDATKAILVGGATPKREADRAEDARPCHVLRIDHVSGPDLLLGIDPETKLLRWVELAAEGDAPTRIRWEAGQVSTDPAPAGTFGVEPPPGVRVVEPLKGDRPAAPAPEP